MRARVARRHVYTDAHDPPRGKLAGADGRDRVALNCLDGKAAKELPRFFADGAVGVKSQWSEGDAVLLNNR